MLNKDLDRALGPTPQSFTNRVDRTLLHLKEEPPVKKLALRTILTYALVAVLLGGTACALVTGSLQDYYTQRFNAYQLNEPDKHNAIMTHLQTEVPQAPAEDPEIHIAVTETSLALDERVLVISVLASAANPAEAELHPLWDLDADGLYMGMDAIIEPGSEERNEHWIWTSKGFGPVHEMVPAEKDLLLLDTPTVCFEGVEIMGDGSSRDAYVTEDGSVHTVIELRLDFMDPAYEDTILARIADQPDNAHYWKQHLDATKRLRHLLETEDAVTLTLPYTITHYTEDDAQLYHGGREAQLTFQVKID